MSNSSYSRTRDEELERFKQDINLMVFAIERYGYEVDRKKSSKNSMCLRSDSDKILVCKDAQSGHYIYASLFNDSDKGSIIDFVQNRTRQSLGHVRQELRAYTGSTATGGYQSTLQKHQQQAVVAVPLKAAFDRQSIIKAMHREVIEPKTFHKYLTKERHISRKTLASPRFDGAIFIDRRGDVVFLHKDREGICGYEKRNSNVKSFSKGGKRALWSSNCYKTDKALVIAESPIDCLALAQMSGLSDVTRYLATSGSLSQLTKELLSLAATRIRSMGGIVVTALDNDKAGKEMTKELTTLLHPDQVLLPRSNDWAQDLDMMMASKSHYDEQEQSMS